MKSAAIQHISTSVHQLIILFALLLAGCSKDFKTITPYKETMVVYGLLNPNDSVQYIRISKAYLGEGNALIMAQQPDSIYYGDILDVKLERYDANGGLTNTYSYNRIALDSVPKDEGGTFVAPQQVVYSGKMKKDSSNTDGIIYKLTVKNRQSGLVATASTNIIENFSINIYNSGHGLDFTALPQQYTLSLQPSNQGKIYSMTMRVYYDDSVPNSSNIVRKYFDWQLGDELSSDNVLSPVPFTFFKSELFIAASSDVTKVAGHVYSFENNIDVYVSGGTDDLYTYMQVTKPANSAVQDRPIFTNIQNGVGLFTCRNTRIKPLKISQETVNRLDSLFQ